MEEYKITKLVSNRFESIPRNYFLYVGDRRNHKNLFYTIELVKK